MSQHQGVKRTLVVFLAAVAMVLGSLAPAPLARAWTVSEDADVAMLGPDNNPRAAYCGGSKQFLAGYTTTGAQRFNITNPTDRYLSIGCSSWNSVGDFEHTTTTAANGKTVMLARVNSGDSYNDRVRVYDSGGDFVWEYQAKDECGQPAKIAARPVVNAQIATFTYQSCERSGEYWMTGINIETQQSVFTNLIGRVSNGSTLSWYTGGFILDDHRGNLRFYSFDGTENVSARVSMTWSNLLTVGTDGTVVFKSRDETDSSKCYLNFRSLGGNTTRRLLDCSGTDSWGPYVMLPNGDVVAGVSFVINNNVVAKIFHRDPAIPDTAIKVVPPARAKANEAFFSHLMVDANGKIVLGFNYNEDVDIPYWPWSKTLDREGILVFDHHGRQESRWLSSVLGDKGFSSSGGFDGYGRANGAIYILGSSEGSTQLEKISAPNVSLSYRDSVRWNMQPVTVTPQLSYVALGDSFSSGEGNPPFESPTDQDDVDECHRSDRAYPRLLSDDTTLDLNLTDFKACSGATTNDVLGFTEADNPHGTWGYPAQVDALSTSTDVVTISIGGNDVGFSDFATECLFPVDTYAGHEGTCDEFTPIYSSTKDKINNTLPERLKSVYRAILNKAPNATVYVLGYPKVAPNKLITDPFDQRCGGLYDAWPNNWGDARAAYTIVGLLNDKIQGAINTINNEKSTTRLVYVPTDTGAFVGHDVCSEESYFNGIHWPNDTEYSIHPNSRGHAAYQHDLKEAMN